MERAEVLLLDALRCAISAQPVSWDPVPGRDDQRQLIRLAREHRILPLLAQAVSGLSTLGEDEPLSRIKDEARSVTLHQAARTGDFLLVLRELETRGLRPAVLKGLVCRSLYPEPEQRPSDDEDLLAPPEDLPAYHEALLACGLRLREPDKPLDGADEVTYVDPARDLYLELHLSPFARDAAAYSDCCAIFDGALSRCVPLPAYGQRIWTLAPTDHLLYLLCHAYKHLLYSGMGVRQICDICLFAREYHAQIDWDRVRRDCSSLGLDTLAAAFFLIGQRHLGIPAPAAFADLQPDELALLHDCLSGGLYGAEDPDRLHSSNITLDAVAAEKQGKWRRGVLASLFPSTDYLKKQYPYLQCRPWLLPVALVQRVFRFLLREQASPTRSVRIGRGRVELLRQYKLLP